MENIHLEFQSIRQAGTYWEQIENTHVRHKVEIIIFQNYF